jgi:mannose/fructose-specific phosphotransferase system component IIA
MEQDSCQSEEEQERQFAQIAEASTHLREWVILTDTSRRVG